MNQIPHLIMAVLYALTALQLCRSGLARIFRAWFVYCALSAVLNLPWFPASRGYWVYFWTVASVIMAIALAWLLLEWFRLTTAELGDSERCWLLAASLCAPMPFLIALHTVSAAGRFGMFVGIRQYWTIWAALFMVAPWVYCRWVSPCPIARPVTRHGAILAVLLAVRVLGATAVKGGLLWLVLPWTDRNWYGVGRIGILLNCAMLITWWLAMPDMRDQFRLFNFSRIPATFRAK